MSEEKPKQIARILSESGSPLMVLESIGREGNKMAIVGRLIGAWPSKMYVELPDVWNMIKLMINWQVISYVLSMPFLALKQGKKTEE